MRVSILSKSPSACSGARPESRPFGSELHQELGKEGQAPEPLLGGPPAGPSTSLGGAGAGGGLGGEEGQWKLGPWREALIPSGLSGQSIYERKGVGWAEKL